MLNPVTLWQGGTAAKVEAMNDDAGRTYDANSALEEAWARYVRELGVRLNRERHRANLSQERLAHMAGLTRHHYQQLEKGESRPRRPANPSLRHVMTLAQALGVGLMELLPQTMPDVTEGR